MSEPRVVAPPAPGTEYTPSPVEPRVEPPVDPTPPEPPRCPNCGAPADGPYCAQCGQSQRDRLRASLPRLLGEGVEELLDVDARVAVTFRRLLFRPGFLTSEYLAGRRSRYVRPLRVYLTASILFFVVLPLASGRVLRSTERGVSTYGGVVRLEPGAARADSLAAQAARDSAVRADTAARADTTASGESGAAQRFLKERLTRFGQLPKEEKARVMRDAVPKAFFALVPVFALLLKLLYVRRGFHYAEHLIFALHFHAFAFLVNTLREVAPTLIHLLFAGHARLAARVAVAPGAHTPAAIERLTDPVLMLSVFVYLFLALRHVYRQSRRRTAAKMALLLPVYGVTVLVGMMTVLFVAMLFA